MHTKQELNIIPNNLCCFSLCVIRIVFITVLIVEINKNLIKKAIRSFNYFLYLYFEILFSRRHGSVYSANLLIFYVFFFFYSPRIRLPVSSGFRVVPSEICFTLCTRRDIWDKYGDLFGGNIEKARNSWEKCCHIQFWIETVIKYGKRDFTYHCI